MDNQSSLGEAVRGTAEQETGSPREGHRGPAEKRTGEPLGDLIAESKLTVLLHS